MPNDQQPSGMNRDERDMLIEVRTTVQAMSADLKEIKNTQANQLKGLEENKVDRAEIVRLAAEQASIHNDFEKRLNAFQEALATQDKANSTFQARVSTWGVVAILALGLIEAAIQIFVK